MKVTEEKIRYNGEIVRVDCILLRQREEEIVLLYRIPREVQIKDVKIPIGSFTIAYYYFNKPYNLYHMVTSKGKVLAYYFNFVKDLTFKNNLLSYKDLIVDILITPDLRHYILDLDELPCSLDAFETGKVKKDIDEFLQVKEEKINYFKKQTKSLIDSGSIELWK